MITKIETTFGWCYTACQIWRKKVTAKGTSLWCDKCKVEPRYPIQRYKLQVQVKDTTGTASFVLFDKDCEQLFAKTARDLLITDGFEPTQLPPIMNYIVGKSYIFQLKVNDYNLHHGSDNYTITRMFSGDDMTATNLQLQQETLENPGKKHFGTKTRSPTNNGIRRIGEKREDTTSQTPIQEDEEDTTAINDDQEDGMLKAQASKGKRRKLIIGGSP